VDCGWWRGGEGEGVRWKAERCWKRRERRRAEWRTNIYHTQTAADRERSINKKKTERRDIPPRSWG